MNYLKLVASNDFDVADAFKIKHLKYNQELSFLKDDIFGGFQQITDDELQDFQKRFYGVNEVGELSSDVKGLMKYLTSSIFYAQFKIEKDGICNIANLIVFTTGELGIRDVNDTFQIHIVKKEKVLKDDNSWEYEYKSFVLNKDDIYEMVHGSLSELSSVKDIMSKNIKVKIVRKIYAALGNRNVQFIEFENYEEL